MTTIRQQLLELCSIQDDITGTSSLEYRNEDMLHNLHADCEALRAKIKDSYGDLLAACEVAADAISCLPEEALGYAQASDGFHEWPIRNELLDNIRAAIAKAKGETDGE